MCRWLAYSGSPLALADLLIKPKHSLIDQSIRSQDNDEPTNGDGFGVGWYDGNRMPGCFHSTKPAWNDGNLVHLSNHIKSPLFLAHVRSSSGSPVQDTNCHPFLYKNWMFQHNGSVPQFSKLKRDMLFAIDPALFPHVRGSTDSELIFFLALTFGLERDPKSALEKVASFVEQLRRGHKIDEPFWFSAAVTDGRRLFAVRYSSDNDSPTLYHSEHPHALKLISGYYEPLPAKSIVVLSEPLDDLQQHWAELCESSFLEVSAGEINVSSFNVG